MSVWNEENTKYLIENYPNKGKEWCCIKLNMKENQIRYKASSLGLKINLNGEFYKNMKKKSAKTITGRKRPNQSEIMKDLWKNGKIKSPCKKERVCVYCGKVFYWDNSKNHRKTCSDDCASKFQSNIWKNKQHPKGMMNKKHSEDTKNLMSIKSSEKWKDINHKGNSIENREKVSMRNSIFHEKGILGGKNSYSNCKRGWYEDNNKKYFMRSGWELNYACYLNFLIKNKEIKDWEYEVDTFRFNGIKQGIVSYKPDFKIFNNDNSIEYHEVKGWMDSKSKTKIKRMAKYYPSIKLIIIGQKEYKSIEKYNHLYFGWK